MAQANQYWRDLALAEATQRSPEATLDPAITQDPLWPKLKAARKAGASYDDLRNVLRGRKGYLVDALQELESPAAPVPQTSVEEIARARHNRPDFVQPPRTAMEQDLSVGRSSLRKSLLAMAPEQMGAVAPPYDTMPTSYEPSSPVEASPSTSVENIASAKQTAIEDLNPDWMTVEAAENPKMASLMPENTDSSNRPELYSRVDVLIEADRRGLLNDKDQLAFDSAVSRGLIDPTPKYDPDQARVKAILRSTEEEALHRAKLGEQFFKPTSVNDWDLNNPALRAKLSRIESAPDAVRFLEQSGELPEKAIAVALEDPDGGRIMGFMIPGEGEEQSQFYKIDSPKEFNISDIADLGNLASIETVAAVGSAFAPAKSIVQRALFEFVGAFSGKTLDEVIDQFTGLEDQTVGDVGKEALESGVINVLGGRAADFAAKVGNAALGRGFRSNEGDELVRRRQAALDAGVDLGIRSAQVGGPLAQKATAISEGLGSGYPGWLPFGGRGVEGISGQRRAGVASTIEEQAFPRSEEGILELEIANLGDRGLLDLISQARREASKEATRDIAGEAPGGMSFPFSETSKEQGGQAVFRGVDEFAENSRTLSNQAYDDYFELAGEKGVVYDVSSLKKKAAELSRRYRLEGEGGKHVEVGPELSPTLQDIIRKISQLEDLQAQNPAEAARALAQIRSTLIDEAEKTPGAGTKTQSQGIASRLLRDLHEVITSPEGSSGSVKSAFEKANKIYKDRAAVLDALSFSRVSRDEIGSGERLFNSLIGDITEDVAIAAKRELPKEEFEKFSSALITDLLRSPSTINSRLLAMGRGGEILVPKNIRPALDVYQRDIKNIDSGILNELFQRQAEDAQAVSAIIEAGSVKELMELASQDVIEKNDLRKLIFQDILDNTTSYREGHLEIDPQVFTSYIEKIKSGKFWQILSSEQRTIVQNAETYASFLKSADSGSSIAAAEIAAAQLSPISNLPRAFNARLKQIQIGIIANLANSDTMAKAMAGRGKVATPMTALRASILLTIQSLYKLAEIERGKDLPES